MEQALGLDAATAVAWGCNAVPRADCSIWLDEVLLALLDVVDIFPVLKFCEDAAA